MEPVDPDPVSYFLMPSLVESNSDDEVVGAVVNSHKGDPVASPHRLNSVNGNAMTLFAFPDVCVKVLGRYRLKFNLIKYRKYVSAWCSTVILTYNFVTFSLCSGMFHHLEWVYSNPFWVYSREAFPGQTSNFF